MIESCKVRVFTALKYDNNPYEVFRFAGNNVIYNLGKIYYKNGNEHKTLEQGDVLVRNEDGSFEVIKNDWEGEK